MIGLGREKDGLYILQLDANIANGCRPTAATIVSPCFCDCWHFRLEYVSNSRLSLLHNHVSDITISPHFHCTTCPIAK